MLISQIRISKYGYNYVVFFSLLKEQDLLAHLVALRDHLYLWLKSFHESVKQGWPEQKDIVFSLSLNESSRGIAFIVQIEINKHSPVGHLHHAVSSWGWSNACTRAEQEESSWASLEEGASRMDGFPWCSLPQQVLPAGRDILLPTVWSCALSIWPWEWAEEAIAGDGVCSRIGPEKSRTGGSGQEGQCTIRESFHADMSWVIGLRVILEISSKYLILEAFPCRRGVGDGLEMSCGKKSSSVWLLWVMRGLVIRHHIKISRRFSAGH